MAVTENIAAAVTENIFVLFTDLVGSTELAYGLPPDEADELRRSHFSVLRRAIASTGGTEVKNLGDGLMVVFQTSSKALACAVSMQQGVDKDNRHRGTNLGLRVGLSVGEATREAEDYFGDPVVEAARLCAVAQGGQILTTEIVKALARRRGYTFANERELELKGLPDPVVAWEITWLALEDDTSSELIPHHLPSAPGFGMVGRARERELLAERFKAVASEAGQAILLIAGEAGVGKTTLASSFARSAYDDGALVLYGRCDEDLAIPYQPFVESLAHFVAHVDDAELAELGIDRLTALGTLLPELKSRLPKLESARASDPDAERWILYGAVASLLGKASARAPVVLVLEDLHWADRPTLYLLRYISSNPVHGLLIIGTYRDAELSSSHPLTDTLAKLARDQRVTRISLSGLEDDEVVTLLEAAAGHRMDDAGVELAHALYRETDGNPFYVAEVLRHLVETRSIVQDEDGRWTQTQGLSEVGLPESIRQVIGTRVARLGDHARGILSAGAVVGQEFELELVAKMVGLDEDSVLDVLEDACSAALTSEMSDTPGHFRFSHALIQHTLYGDLSTTRRARLHRMAAEALEDLCGAEPGERTVELARHWLASIQPAESKKAITYSRLAADRALEALAPSEAVRWYEEALAVLGNSPDDGERARCLAGLGEAKRQLGDSAFRGILLEAARVARSAGDVDTLVRAALANTRGAATVGESDAELVETLQASLDAIGSVETPARARLLSSLANVRAYDGDYASRRAMADEALGIARRLGDPETLVYVLTGRISFARADTLVETYGQIVEAEAIALDLGDPVLQLRVFIIRALLAICMGDTEDVERCHGHATALAIKVGEPFLTWTATFHRSWSALLFGDVGKAEALATEAFQIGNDSGQPDAIVIYGALLGAIRWHQGRMAELADVLAGIVADNPALSPFKAAVAMAYAESDRDEEATAMLGEEFSKGFSGPNDFLMPSYLSQWAEVAAHLGHLPAAKMLYQRLSPWSEFVVFSGLTVHGAVTHLLGILSNVMGNYEEAEAQFEQALATHQKIAAPFFTARTSLEWGRMLASSHLHSPSKASSLLESARDISRRHGFARIEKQSEATLTELDRA